MIFLKWSTCYATLLLIMKWCISLSLQKLICNLITMKKMIKRFLPIAHIHEINLCVTGIEDHLIYLKVYLINLIYSHFVLLVGQRHFSIQRNVLCMKKPTVSLLITLSKSVMTARKCLMIVTPSIRTNLIMSKTYNIRLPITNDLTIMNK